MLEAGRITAIGSHDELLSSSATYQKLYQLQFMDMPEALDLAATQIPDPNLMYLPFDERAAIAAGAKE